MPLSRRLGFQTLKRAGAFEPPRTVLFDVKTGRQTMRKPKAAASKLAVKRHQADLSRKKVTGAMACRVIKIDFERVAQICAMPREDQEKILGAEALQVLDVLMQGCSAGGFQL